MFSGCDCSSKKSDAGRPPSREPQCKAGYYTGNFVGKYRPSAFGLGIFGGFVEADIEGGESLFDETLPPLSFTLSESIDNAGGEFATYTVGGGCMQGQAASSGTRSPFAAKLTGNLDCATGVFDGYLQGYYTLIGIPGADFMFTGPFTGQFQLSDNSLQGGEWSIEEPPAATGEAAGGGEGSWEAKWTADKAPDTGQKDPCADLGSDDAGAPRDAGARRDAGAASGN